MWSTIHRLVEYGCSIVLTTHYLEEAEALADRVAVPARCELIARRIEITAAEGVVRRLLAADASVRNLEVKQAGLAEAFAELTKKAA